MESKDGQFSSPSCEQTAREAWAAKEAQVLIELIHRMMREPEEKRPRIKRLLRDVFYALGSTGMHFTEAIVLLDPLHRRHQEVLKACQSAGVLPADFATDPEIGRLPKSRKDECLAAIDRIFREMRRRYPDRT